MANDISTIRIPEPDGERPFGGHAHLLDLDAPIGSMGELAEKYGEIYKLKFPGGAELVVISSQALIAELCDESRFDKMVSGALYKIRDFALDGLFTAHTREDNWHRAHQLLAPAFSMGSMQDYFPKMLDVSQQLCDRWQRLNRSDAVDVPDEMVRLTLEVIGLCGFDYRFDSFGREEAHPFVAAMGLCLGEAMARSVRLPIFTKLAVNKNRAYEDGIEYMNSVVDTVIKERKETGKVGEVGDLLDLMLQSQQDPESGLSDENIRYQIITFLIAGHETTSGLLAFTLNHLLKHPAVMTRARAEVDRVLGHDLTKQPTLRDVSGLAYIRQILNEALRLHPTAPAMQLTPYEDTVIGGKYKVKKGYPLLALTTQLHRDPKVWGENAHLFNPENFAPAREKDRPPHAFKPFGNGQRACIGSQFAMQESTLVIGMILQRFNLVDHTDYRLRIKETLTFKPDNFYLQVRERSDADREEVLEATDRQISQATNPALAVRTDHQTPLTILYGSNMGSARQIAQRLADEGESQGYATTLATLDDAVAALPESGVLLVVCASYNGQPPDNAGKFFNWLEAEVETAGATPVNSALKFAVLGVGNQDWATTYQRVPRLLDDWLERAGGERLLARGEADARSDFFGQVDDFLPQAWHAAAVSFDLLDASGASAAAPQAASRYRVDALHHGAQEQRFPDMQSFEVIENDCLAEPGTAYGEAKHHISLRLPEGVTYKTGDHLLVMPRNRGELVQRVAERFGMPLDQTLAIMRNTPGDDPLPIGQELTVAELLTHYVELQDPMSLRILNKLVDFIGCPNRRGEAEKLAQDGERFEREVNAPRVSLLQYLEAAPECELPFELFLEFVAPMRPRYYSISSSALVEPRSVDLTLSVLSAPQPVFPPVATDEKSAETATTYEGSCSHYLAECEPGSTVTARVRAVESHFLPPADLATPIIMIGPGTGVAPFRGFLQDRMWHQQNGAAELGDAMLFFGCRHPDADFMYRSELERAHRDSLVELSVAYSRVGDAPLPAADYFQISGYVQDAIASQGERVWELIERGALIYVCGDAAKMLPDVRRALSGLAQKYDAQLADKPLSQTSEEADRWLADLEAESRFLVDAWA